MNKRKKRSEPLDNFILLCHHLPVPTLRNRWKSIYRLYRFRQQSETFDAFGFDEIIHTLFAHEMSSDGHCSELEWWINLCSQKENSLKYPVKNRIILYKILGKVQIQIVKPRLP